MPHARKTCRLLDALRNIGFACGGQGGSRLASELGMQTSADTLLRLMRKTPAIAPVELPPVTILGVDDWAWRKGPRYGTILCDLQRHRVIDLLPERSAQDLRSWLIGHPAIRIISRDRAGYYAQGAADGAPQAMQVADRFHLIHNVHDALARTVDGHYQQLRQAVADVNRRRIERQRQRQQQHCESPCGASDRESELTAEAPVPPRLTSRQIASRARRQQLYQQIVQLHAQKLSMRGIARQLNVDRETVKRYLQAGVGGGSREPSPRPRAARKYRSRVDPFEPYLRLRWDQGCHNAAKLARELRTQGFAGSYFSVRRRVARWELRNSSGGNDFTADTVRTPSPKSAAWLLLKKDPDLDEQDRELREAILNRCPELRAASSLAREFCEIVREHRSDALDEWMMRACASGSPRPLQVFAHVLKKDLSAVRAALTLPWSNGQVEGQINRLKLIKRQMYGRGNLDLLRMRMLNAA